jgi:class 3 adenylate cyclase
LLTGTAQRFILPCLHALGRTSEVDEVRPEHRLAAILAADVVGYSRLMAADETGTHTRLKSLRKDFIEPTIAAHHGRIVKLMGDGALVEFASAVDAVECAVAIQRGSPSAKRTYGRSSA